VSEARRGDLWLLDFGDPVGRERGWTRPALVVSSDHWNRHAETLTVMPLTRTKHDLPTRVEIEPDRRNGLDETSYARCEDIRSVSDRRLLHRLGTTDAVVMSSIGRVVRIFLEL
jgi:mRNA interferase MazF